MTMNDDLKDDIKKGTMLQKIPDDEIKSREEEKRKRMEELKKIAERLEKNGDG